MQKKQAKKQKNNVFCVKIYDYKTIAGAQDPIFHFLIIRRTKCYGRQVIRSVSEVLHIGMKWRCFILWSFGGLSRRNEMKTETMLHRQAFL